MSELTDQNGYIREGYYFFYNFILIKDKNAASSKESLQKDYVSLLHSNDYIEETYVPSPEDALASKWGDPFSPRSQKLLGKDHHAEARHPQ